MDKILMSLRTLLIDHLAATATLTANVPLGGLTVSIPNSSRFRIDDDIFFISVAANMTELAHIVDIPDDKTLILQSGTTRAWTTAESAYIQKAVNGEFLKGVYIGDLKTIPKFPAITIDVLEESNEWFTLRQTSHEYKFLIRAYVLEDNFETTNLRCIRLATQIREILLDHIRPIIDGVSHPLTLDLPAGQTVVSMANTTGFIVNGPVFLRDANPRPAHQESYVKAVLTPTTLELRAPSDFDYLVSRQAEIIFVKRLLYDTRPESINYGSIVKGSSFCRAADIQWFAKEMRLREGNLLT